MTTAGEGAKGTQNVLAPVIERLREESQVALRLAREDFARELALLRRRQQISFAVGFGVFVVASAVLITTTYFSLRSVIDAAQSQMAAQQQAASRLSRLEEESRARLESLQALDRRLRVELLDGPPAKPAESPPAQAPGQGAGEPVAGGEKANPLPPEER